MDIKEGGRVVVEKIFILLFFRFVDFHQLERTPLTLQSRFLADLPGVMESCVDRWDTVEYFRDSQHVPDSPLSLS